MTSYSMMHGGLLTTVNEGYYYVFLGVGVTVRGSRCTDKDHSKLIGDWTLNFAITFFP